MEQQVYPDNDELNIRQTRVDLEFRRKIGLLFTYAKQSHQRASENHESLRAH